MMGFSSVGIVRVKLKTSWGEAADWYIKGNVGTVRRNMQYGRKERAIC